MRRLLLLLLLPATATAAPPFPGVLDVAGRAAYVASDVGIDAIDLERGDLLWRSREAQQPLAVAGGRLYALGFHPTNQLSVVAIDLGSKAERVIRTEVTDLPRWVVTRDTPTQTFRCDWRQHGGEVLIDWRAEARAGSGPAKRAAGQVCLDLETGRVRSAPGAAQPAPGRPPSPLDKHAIRWHGVVGWQLLVVVSEEVPGSTARQQRLVFRAWDARAAREAPPRELLRGERLTLLADLDGKHLWLRDAAGPDDPLAPHTWSVVSALDGHLVARVPFVPGTRAVTLAGRRAYCVSAAPAKAPLGYGPPRLVHTLHAVDLDAGKVVWSRPAAGHSGQRSMTR
jgi:hypothetical protein